MTTVRTTIEDVLNRQVVAAVVKEIDVPTLAKKLAPRVEKALGDSILAVISSSGMRHLLLENFEGLGNAVSKEVQGLLVRTLQAVRTAPEKTTTRPKRRKKLTRPQGKGKK